jgi:hypothetical protein
VEEGKRLKYVSVIDAAFWIGSYEGSRCHSCLLRSYPSSALSGARWALYRRNE